MGSGMNFSHVDKLEIVISVTKNETIGFRVYPHYKGEYINIGKARDPLGLAKKLLFMSDRNFLYWGIDDAGDTFAGYTFTLESGFPSEAIMIVERRFISSPFWARSARSINRRRGDRQN